MEEHIRKNDNKIEQIDKLLKEHISGMEDRRKKLLKDFTEIVKNETSPLHKMLEKQNEATGIAHDKAELHYARVEPVIKAYEDSKVFNDTIERKGTIIVKTSATLAAIGYIWFLVTKGYNK